jgi:hypothetical protein
MAMIPDYKTPNDMQEKIDEYFDKLEKREKPNISELCYHLGFCSRQSFYDYGKKKIFSYTIKRAKLRIQIHYEKQLNYNGCTGAIFALKNFGWRDELQHTGELGAIIINRSNK